MDKTTRNSLVWGGVLIVEAMILRLAKKSEIWFYIMLPIIIGFLLTELIFPIPREKRRNLK